MELYMRYMDDGRKFLHPIRYGWRWMGDTMVYTKRWALEDRVENKSHLDMTSTL